jgi:hypothetical protein
VVVAAVGDELLGALAGPADLAAEPRNLVTPPVVKAL